MFFKKNLRYFSFYKFKKARVNHQTIIYDPNYDMGLMEYYNYIVDLLIQATLSIPYRGVSLKIMIGVSQSLKYTCSRTKSIDFQVEHVLVKPNGRGAEKAPLGRTKIANTNDFYAVRIQHIDELLNRDMIIEYSRPNVKHIQQSDLYQEYLAKICVISPTLYSIKANSILNTTRSKKTITLFRNLNEPRRKQFLDNLYQLKIESQNVNHVFKNLHLIYEDTKILINIHQTDDHHTLEELRILPALRCGVIVISEDSPLKEYCRFSQFVIWETIENMPERIQDIQNNYETYHKQLFTSDFFRRMARLEKSNLLRMKMGVQKLLA